MITPEYLEYKLDMLKVHKELTESILRDIARRIVKAGVTDTASWQTERLQECGMIYKDITKAVAEYTGRLESEICADFEDMQTDVFDYDDEILIKNGYEPQTIKNISPEMHQIIDAALKKTTTEAVNLTKTTAITTQNMYLTACDLAHMQVASGAFSYQEAIKSAIISAAQQGVKVLYPSGWVSSMDVAVRRSVLTGVNQTAGTLQKMRADEIGSDLMELSAHYAARPSHAEWQGQIVSLSGQKGYLTLDDIGYGAVDGFMGANCRHNWYMFFDGDKRTYTDEYLKELANQKVTYNGKEMLVSEGKDMQRRFERGIRKTKQELVMLDEGIKTAKDPKVTESLKEQFTVSSMKLKRQEATLRDFCKQTDLRRDRFREQAFAAKTENGIRNFGKSTSGKAVWANKKGLTAKDERDIIKSVKTNTEVQDVHYIGKIDKSIYKCVTEDIRTDEIIITDERIQHIKERHPNDYERYCLYMREAVLHPEYIIEANKPNSALVLKSFADEELKQFKSVVKITTSLDADSFKNSVITFMKIDDKEWKRLIKNKKILYKSE